MGVSASHQSSLTNTGVMQHVTRLCMLTFRLERKHFVGQGCFHFTHSFSYVSDVRELCDGTKNIRGSSTLAACIVDR